MAKPSSSRRVPAFSPVPLRGRRDGWTPMRQADFLGALAETRSVTKAARRVGLSRESAYRLRRKPGAESFATAWDGLLSELPPRKFTIERLWRRALGSRLRPLIRAGRHVATLEIPDDAALARLYRRLLRERRKRL